MESPVFKEMLESPAATDLPADLDVPDSLAPFPHPDVPDAPATTDALDPEEPPETPEDLAAPETTEELDAPDLPESLEPPEDLASLESREWTADLEAMLPTALALLATTTSTRAKLS